MRLGTPGWFEAQFREADGPEGDAWGHRWRGSQRYRHDLSFSMVRPLISRGEKLSILDIGCAAADFTALLQGPGRRVTAIDISPRAAHIARRQCPAVESAAAALPALPFGPRSFDLVVALEVLYYLSPAERREGVREMHRVLRPGGHLLFSGQIDGNVKYHSREELDEILSPYFRIEATREVHTRLYYSLEGRMLTLMRSLKRISPRLPPPLSSCLGLAGGLVKTAIIPKVLPSVFDRIGAGATRSKGAGAVIILGRRREKEAGLEPFIETSTRLA